MDLAVAILIQVVNWPLAALLAWRAARGGVPRLAAATVVVLLASSGGVCARAVRAASKRGGNSRFRCSDRLKIPAAAFWLK